MLCGLPLTLRVISSYLQNPNANTLSTTPHIAWWPHRMRLCVKHCVPKVVGPTNSPLRCCCVWQTTLFRNDCVYIIYIYMCMFSLDRLWLLSRFKFRSVFGSHSLCLSTYRILIARCFVLACLVEANSFLGSRESGWPGPCEAI